MVKPFAKIVSVALLGLLGAVFYGMYLLPSRGAILKEAFHLQDHNVLVARTNSQSRRSSFDATVANGDVVFDKPGTFEAYIEGLDDPKWRTLSWPPQGRERRVVALNEDVVWRDLETSDQVVWRELSSLGRPPGEKGRILCFHVVLQDEGGEGVPCDDEPASSAGRVWAGIDPQNRALYMRVEFAEAPGLTGNKFLDYLVQNAR